MQFTRAVDELALGIELSQIADLLAIDDPRNTALADHAGENPSQLPECDEADELLISACSCSGTETGRKQL